jgi:riboflavin synthase
VFTGLISAIGRVAALDAGRLRVEAASLDLRAGDSIAVDGVCLTAAAVEDGAFEADVMGETLGRTTLGALAFGDRVNLESPLRAGDPLGGHVVQGHVDATGAIEAVTPDGFASVVRIAAPPALLRYVVEKGSIAVSGVSLTVMDVDGDGFSVSLIPETLERTTLGEAEPGRAVNLEVDVLAKYVEKLTAAPPIRR